MTSTEPELDRLFERVSSYFAVLADSTRLRILNAVCDQERSVSDIVECVGSTQTNVSRHLNLMYGKGLLTRRRDGAMTLYAVADPAIVTLCRTACVQIASMGEERAVSSRALRRFMAQGA